MKKIISALLMVAVSSSAFAMTDKEMTEFKAAESALDQQKYENYYHLKARLESTALYPYLQYQEISKNPKIFEQDTIEAYLQDNKGSYWGYLLKKDLAQYYAKSGQWPLFLQYYDDNLGMTGQCWQVTAWYKLGEKKKALKTFSKMWLQNTRLPAYCETVAEAFKASDLLGSDLYQQKANNLALKGYYMEAVDLIEKTKDSKEIQYYEHWQAAATNLKNVTAWIKSDSAHAGFSEALIAIMDYHSRQDTVETADFWSGLLNDTTLKVADRISAKTINKINAEIAIDFARSYDKAALIWLSKIEDKYASSLLWQWRLRSALYWSDYKSYFAWYDKMPKSLQYEDAWEYWQAKSLMAMGDKKKAEILFEALAKKRSYYGFLSADMINAAYALDSKTYKPDQALIDKMKKTAEIEQVLDLYQLRRYDLAYSLWRWNIGGFNKDELMALADFTNDKKMYALSVNAYANAGVSDDLSGRFPKAYLTEVDAAAKKFNLNPALILSIMRQESVYRVMAKSYADAYGLMQLLPSTAQFLANRYKLPYEGESSLYKPAVNVMLGAANLDFLDGLFKGNVILGLASYNAGQGNVAKWLPDHEMAADKWVEIIPYGETRTYIKNILSYLVVYHVAILGDKDFRLTTVLKPISKESKH
ncbi:MAG: transglycosylase SLT domain-containing protein [Francisellaceae bacterium]